MGKMRLATTVLTLMITGTAAQAACNQAHINNKTWKLTAHEVTENLLIFCTFKTSSGGSIAVAPDGCEVTKIPVADFSSPTKFNIEASSQIVATPGQKCTFDATINLKSGETPAVITARLVMESGKTIASGNFLMGDGGGTVSVLRQ